MVDNTGYSLILNRNIADLKDESLFIEHFKNTELRSIGHKHYLTNKSKGIGLVFDQELISRTIHFYRGLVDGSSQFMGELPYKIEFNDNIDLLQKKMVNMKYVSGYGEELPVLGKSNPWLRYDFDSIYMHIEFNESGSINLVTLGIQR
jgi:hypothetical protein